MKRYDFVLVGNLIVDEVKRIDAYPQKLHMATVLDVTRCLGGLVGNCAADLARLDPTLRVCALARIGGDEYGRFALERLAADSTADLSFVKIGGHTSVTDVMTVASTGERTFFANRGDGGRLDVEDVPFDEIEGGIFHVGYALLMEALDAPDAVYGTRMARLLHDAREHGFLTSLDVVSETGTRYRTLVPPSLRYTDYFAVNELEAGGITGIPLRDGDRLLTDNLQPVCRRLKEMGVGRWAVIHMPELSYGVDEGGCFHIAPSISLPEGWIQGSVGAGDAFTSALLLCAYRGMPLYESLRAANAAAAMSLSQPGASEAVVPVAEAMKLYDRFGERKIEIC